MSEDLSLEIKTASEGTTDAVSTNGSTGTADAVVVGGRKAPAKYVPMHGPNAPQGTSMRSVKVEDKKNHAVPFYIYNTDGRQRFLPTKIYVDAPTFFNPGKGRTEADYNKSVYVEFKNGTYLSKDPDITEFLRVYQEGGEYQWRGETRIHPAQTFLMWVISEELRVKLEGGDLQVINKAGAPRAFLESLPVESLYAFAQ